MSWTSIAGIGSVTAAAAATPAPSQTMDSEVFLQLLVTQLQNQDPSSPMNTNEMMAQTTQLAMMESLAALQTLSEESFGLQMRSVAAAFIGREVDYVDEGGATVRGRVDGVSFAGGTPALSIGGASVPLSAVSALRTTEL